MTFRIPGKDPSRQASRRNGQEKGDMDTLRHLQKVRTIRHFTGEEGVFLASPCQIQEPRASGRLVLPVCMILDVSNEETQRLAVEALKSLTNLATLVDNVI